MHNSLHHRDKPCGVSRSARRAVANDRCLREATTRRLGLTLEAAGGRPNRKAAPPANVAAPIMAIGSARRCARRWAVAAVQAAPSSHPSGGLAPRPAVGHSGLRPDAAPGPPLRPAWASASADQGGDEVGGPPDLRRLGCLPRPITGLPAGARAKLRVATGRKEGRIATVAEPKGASLVHGEGWHKFPASPICNAGQRAGPGNFDFSPVATGDRDRRSPGQGSFGNPSRGRRVSVGCPCPPPTTSPERSLTRADPAPPVFFRVFQPLPPLFAAAEMRGCPRRHRGGLCFFLFPPAQSAGAGQRSADYCRHLAFATKATTKTSGDDRGHQLIDRLRNVVPALL